MKSSVLSSMRAMPQMLTQLDTADTGRVLTLPDVSPTVMRRARCHMSLQVARIQRHATEPGDIFCLRLQNWQQTAAATAAAEPI